MGALEPRFYAELLDGLGLDPAGLPGQYDRDGWPALRAALSARFAERTRDEWAAAFDGSDACVAPVLSMADAPGHPHNAARGTFTEVAGVTQPAPAPRFSRTPAGQRRPRPRRAATPARSWPSWATPRRKSPRSAAAQLDRLDDEQDH